MSRASVLVIDDEPDMLENCRRLLSHAGFVPHTLNDPTQLHDALAASSPDVLLLDLRMPEVDGMTVLAAALAVDPMLPVIIMTAYATVTSAVQAIREGAFDYIGKPFSREQLVVTVERAVRYRGLTIENRELRERVEGRGFDPIIGASPAITRLLEQVERVAPSEANVLIAGESGTGKELVARSIHQHSKRRSGPFVPLDCAALPEALLESELFGHERGAFTGAVTRKVGLFVAASGGTVFLDEVGELPGSLQAKLLRALEERQVRPVGSTSLAAIDIRLVAATNIDLTKAVNRGLFRQDLFYRLNVVQLDVPPLRVRTGDLPLLVHAFLKRFADEAGRDPPRVSPEAWTALEAYRWPGNVRELRNLAQRLVVMDDDGRITVSDLPDVVRGWADGPAEEVPPPYATAREKAIIAFRRAYIQRLLAHHDGNISRAAVTAGVSRRTLHRWLAGDTAETTTPPERD